MQDSFEKIRRQIHELEGLGHANQQVRDILLVMLTDLEAEFSQKVKASSEAINRHSKLVKMHESLTDQYNKGQRTIETHVSTIAHMTQIIKDQQNELAEQERANLNEDVW